MRRLGLITCVLTAMLPSLASADMMATTDDNRRVVLRPDGTWALVNPPGEDNNVNVITFGVVGVEPLQAVRPTCAVLSRFDNDSGLTIGSATVDTMAGKLEGSCRRIALARARGPHRPDVAAA